MVENESDIVGHIAYALYKHDKLEYIVHFAESHGSDPTEEELEAFHDISSRPDSVSKYRLVASHIISDFLDNALKESIKRIEADCSNHMAEIFQESIRPLLPKRKSTAFWHGVLQSVAGAFIFALIVAAFVFIKSYNGA